MRSKSPFQGSRSESSVTGAACAVAANSRSVSALMGGPPECRASSPLQPFADRAPHDPVLVALGQELQLLGEMRDALAPGHAVEGRVGQVGPPVAALRPVRVV